MAVVVSDTSPIRALAHLDLLPVLHALFGKVLIPPAVVRELLDPPDRFVSLVVADFSFLEVCSPADTGLVGRLRQTLDLGEAEAIALAGEVQAEARLIDEDVGRGVARRMGLLPLGTVGLLLRAKVRGLCGDIGPLLERLRSELRFFISESLFSKVVRLAGEKNPTAD